MSMLQNIRRVLVANRGEIAVRVIRACRQLGVESVAVVSEADRASVAAGLADRVVCIGEAEAASSYLDVAAILEAARETSADAIHPGYGFLAENADFARGVAKAGFIFVGPAPEVIDAMGVKTTARERMQAAGVPVVPGAMLPEGEDAAALLEVGRSVGYPLMVKAAAGGGGKGMRAVPDESGLVEAIAAARREATAAFANGTVYLERLLEDPRHVEVQVLGDSHGNVVHLGERDCSIQRRHQKVVEEAPAPGLDDSLRNRMQQAAVKAARAVGYEGAGTVEMLLDRSGEFFFLEMNTRLQVEHPVTELVWGVDLVEQQLRIADGQALHFGQEDLSPRGHAIEVRLYAEDPASGFLPQTGQIGVFEAPAGPGVRVDAGVETGTEVTLHYDPMLAKICAAGPDRDAARRRLVLALQDTVLLGVNTNQEYLRAVLRHPAFATGEVHTGFLSQHEPGKATAQFDEDETRVLLAAAAAVFSGRVDRGSRDARPGGAASAPGPWQQLGAWHPGRV